MKLLLVILFVAVLVGVIAHARRRGSVHGGYRRRFENRYGHDASGDSGIPTTVFMTGFGSADSHQAAHGHSHDCGTHAAHSDGGSGCGDGN